jgi:hypothetical protein
MDLSMTSCGRRLELKGGWTDGHVLVIPNEVEFVNFGNWYVLLYVNKNLEMAPEESLTGVQYGMTIIST